MPKPKELVRLEPENENVLWSDALIIFDTSAICGLYNCIGTAAATIVGILNHLKDRIWIPAQVMIEYERNREKAIHNPIAEKYGGKRFRDYKQFADRLSQDLKEHEEEYFHPYIETEPYADIKKEIASIKTALESINNSYQTQYEKRIAEIKKFEANDEIHQTFKTFNKGKEYPMSRILEIVAEGDIRYRNTIPPGYMDGSSKESIRKYGDLIIWKEILDQAKEAKRPVIFVCDDLKEDWYVKDGNNNSIGPREELRKEFADSVGQPFWMYSLKEFVNNLEKHFKHGDTLPLFSGLELVKMAMERSELERKLKEEKYLIVQCDHCREEFHIFKNDIDFDWNIANVDDRSMGEERMFTTTFREQCPHCQHNIEVTFEVWEYPTGVINHTNIECDGGEIHSKFDFSDEISFAANVEQCCLCGCHYIGSSDYCPDCENEIARKMSRDD